MGSTASNGLMRVRWQVKVFRTRHKLGEIQICDEFEASEGKLDAWPTVNLLTNDSFSLNLAIFGFKTHVVSMSSAFWSLLSQHYSAETQNYFRLQRSWSPIHLTPSSSCLGSRVGLFRFCRVGC